MRRHICFVMQVHEKSGGNMNNRPIKTVSDSKTVQVHLISPKSLNSLGRLFGGNSLAGLMRLPVLLPGGTAEGPL